MILVTGATGLNGSAAIREFVRRREPVRALVRSAAKAASLGTPETVEVVEGDMLCQGTLGAALEGVDRVLMISGAPVELWVKGSSGEVDDDAGAAEVDERDERLGGVKAEAAVADQPDL